MEKLEREKSVAVQRLLRLIARAYYSDAHVALMDCFVHIIKQDFSHKNTVPEQDILGQSRLGIKQVREILIKFRNDQILISSATHLKEEEAENLGKVIKGRELKSKVPKKKEILQDWKVEPRQLIKVIKLRHQRIFDQLNAKEDSAKQIYVCPNSDCKKGPFGYDVLSELMVDPDLMDDQRNFVCKYCKVERDGEWQGQILIPKKDESKQNVNVQADLKRFNEQLAKIMEQVRSLDDLLKMELKLRADDGARVGLEDDYASKNPKKKIKLSRSSRKGIRVAVIKRNDISAVASNSLDRKPNLAPLEWDHLAHKQLAQQKREAEITQMQRQAEETKRQNQLMQDRYKEEYTDWLRKQDQNGTKASPSSSSSTTITKTTKTLTTTNGEYQDEASSGSESDVNLSIGGELVACKLSRLMQDQGRLDKMTPQEFGVYSSVVSEFYSDPFI